MYQIPGGKQYDNMPKYIVNKCYQQTLLDFKKKVNQ